MKRKYKIVLIILFGILTSILMSILSIKERRTIMFIGDSYLNNNKIVNKYIEKYSGSTPIKNSNKEYIIDDMTSSELLNILYKNIKLNNTTIQNEIFKANIIFISIGNDEILKKNANLNIYLYNVDKLLSLIRSINKKKIYFIGLSGDYSKINDVNKWIKNICLKNNIEFIIME